MAYSTLQLVRHRRHTVPFMLLSQNMDIHTMISYFHSSDIRGHKSENT